MDAAFTGVHFTLLGGLRARCARSVRGHAAFDRDFPESTRYCASWVPAQCAGGNALGHRAGGDPVRRGRTSGEDRDGNASRRSGRARHEQGKSCKFPSAPGSIGQCLPRRKAAKSTSPERLTSNHAAVDGFGHGARSCPARPDSHRVSEPGRQPVSIVPLYPHHFHHLDHLHHFHHASASASNPPPIAYLCGGISLRVHSTHDSPCTDACLRACLGCLHLAPGPSCHVRTGDVALGGGHCCPRHHLHPAQLGSSSARQTYISRAALGLFLA